MEAANVENTKICTGCKKEMLATKEFFHSSKGGKYGLNAKCKKCKNAINKKYKKDNFEKVKEYHRKYRKNNPEKIKEIKRKFYKNNTEKVSEYGKKYRKENVEKVKERHRKYRKENVEKLRKRDIIRTKEYRKNNAEKIKERRIKNTENLSSSYIASIFRKPIKHLNPQIIETRRLIILIKRELRKNNFKTLETMQEDSTNKNNSQMENNLKENDNKRDLNFEVKNSDDLNKMLSGFLMDVRRGSVTHYSANSINLVADKINKNNLNQLEYKRLSGGNRKIDFFEKE